MRAVVDSGLEPSSRRVRSTRARRVGPSSVTSGRWAWGCLLLGSGGVAMGERRKARPVDMPVTVKNGPARPAAQTAAAALVVGVVDAWMGPCPRPGAEDASPCRTPPGRRHGSNALDLYRNGHYDEAYHAFEDLAKKEPGRGFSLQFNAGASAYMGKQYDEALDAFRARAGVRRQSPICRPSRTTISATRLFRRGEEQKDREAKIKDWKNAIQHYNSTLDMLKTRRVRKPVGEQHGLQPRPRTKTLGSTRRLKQPPQQQQQKHDQKNDKQQKNDQQQNDPQKQDQQQKQDQSAETGSATKAGSAESAKPAGPRAATATDQDQRNQQSEPGSIAAERPAAERSVAKGPAADQPDQIVTIVVREVIRPEVRTPTSRRNHEDGQKSEPRDQPPDPSSLPNQDQPRQHVAISRPKGSPTPDRVKPRRPPATNRPPRPKEEDGKMSPVPGPRAARFPQGRRRPRDAQRHARQPQEGKMKPSPRTGRTRRALAADPGIRRSLLCVLLTGPVAAVAQSNGNATVSATLVDPSVDAGQPAEYHIDVVNGHPERRAARAAGGPGLTITYGGENQLAADQPRFRQRVPDAAYDHDDLSFTVSKPVTPDTVRTIPGQQIDVEGITLRTLPVTLNVHGRGRARERRRAGAVDGRRTGHPENQRRTLARASRRSCARSFGLAVHLLQQADGGPDPQGRGVQRAESSPGRTRVDMREVIEGYAGHVSSPTKPPSRA